MSARAPVLESVGLSKTFRVPVRGRIGRKAKQELLAVDSVDLTVQPQEILGIVGESGCGKSTLGRLLSGLIPSSSGQRLFNGEDVTDLTAKQSRSIRPKIQMVFQDPYSSLNPRRTIGQSLVEPLEINTMISRAEARERAVAALKSVGLEERHLASYPHQFSGGQRQRIGIARALILEPSVVVADEPVSALDMSVQGQILNLINDLREDSDFAMILISHDIAVIRHMADRVAVMYLGQIVEMGRVDDVVHAPKHPYTQSLIASIPTAAPGSLRERIVLKGDLPSPLDPPSGCRFRTRCPVAMPICAEVTPPLIELGDDRSVACHLYPGPGLAKTDGLRPAAEPPAFV